MSVAFVSIRALNRPSRPPASSMNRADLSPDSPYLVLDELEPDGLGNEVATTTVFLTASECPVGCHMCDLHRNTLLTATPAGAIPRQIEAALERRGEGQWIKLYNSGNFFDPRSIPTCDYVTIARKCDRFRRVIVENHPRFGADRLRRFRDLIEGQLEVAVGLETVQPRWLERLGKQITRDDFDRYATWLRNENVDLRVFLIVGVPGIDVTESIRWARLSTRHAIHSGARHVSLIPARLGHGWNGQGYRLPHISTDQLAELQSKVLEDAAGEAAITIDLWDMDESDPRLAAMRMTNRTQKASRS